MLKTHQLRKGKTYSRPGLWKSNCTLVFKDKEGVLLKFVDGVSKGGHIFIKHDDFYKPEFTEVKKQKTAYLRMITNGVNVWGYVSTNKTYRGKGQVLSQFEVTVSGHLTTAPRKNTSDDLMMEDSDWTFPEI